MTYLWVQCNAQKLALKALPTSFERTARGPSTSKLWECDAIHRAATTAAQSIKVHNHNPQSESTASTWRCMLWISCLCPKHAHVCSQLWLVGMWSFSTLSNWPSPTSWTHYYKLRTFFKRCYILIKTFFFYFKDLEGNGIIPNENSEEAQVNCPPQMPLFIHVPHPSLSIQPCQQA